MIKENPPNSKIIGVNLQLIEKEFDSIENATKSTPFAIFKLSYKFTHVTQRGNQHDIFDYQIFNAAGREESPKVNNWYIKNIIKADFFCRDDSKRFGMKVESWGSGVKANFVDSLGQINSRIIFSPQEMIAYLIEISSYNTWEEFFLKQENVELLERIKELETEIKSLKETKR